MAMHLPQITDIQQVATLTSSGYYRAPFGTLRVTVRQDHPVERVAYSAYDSRGILQGRGRWTHQGQHQPLYLNSFGELTCEYPQSK